MLAMRVRSVIPGAARPQQYLGVVFVAVEEPGFSPANHGPFTAGVAAATGAKALFHWRAFGTAEAVPFHRSGNRESHARTSARESHALGLARLKPCPSAAPATGKATPALRHGESHALGLARLKPCSHFGIAEPSTAQIQTDPLPDFFSFFPE